MVDTDAAAPHPHLRQGQAAVVVPLADFMRLRALERLATDRELQDAEDTAALQEWKAREGAGQTSYTPADEVRRLGLTRRRVSADRLR